jgi:anti-anti-sigma factor
MDLVKEAFSPDKPALIRVRGALTIYEVAELRDLLLEGLDQTRGLRLNLGEVSECDTAGIQLLYSARMSAREREKQFEITELSPSVQNTAEVIGIDAQALFTAI